MKILIVNYSDKHGGAAKAAYRLHLGLLSQGIDSNMLVQSKISDDYTVIGPQTKKQKLLAFLRLKIDKLPVIIYKKRDSDLFSPAWLPFSKIVDKINSIKPDIVHLHWICNGMIRVEDLTKIKVPIIWSLHDEWAFTGGCHFKFNCKRYLKNCGTCPNLGSEIKKDLSKRILNRKISTYNRIDNLIIVGLSSWIAKCASKSAAFKKKKIVNLPNTIDVNIYKPINKFIASEILNFPKNKKVILFGAIKATQSKRKGFEILVRALEQLNPFIAEIVVFGSSKPFTIREVKQSFHYLGKLHDDISLSLLYSTADVTVVPSLQENLSNVIMESLSCGTPVVAFDIGGNSDMIDHKKNGYLVKPYDPYDLEKGITWVIENPDNIDFSKNSRNKIVNNFSEEIIIPKYIDLYKSILNDK